jgi:predicted hotdog family 3-hydroxylacyl-ACP dehydratase
MSPKDINIRELLPQQGKFVAIDVLESIDATKAVTSTIVDRDSLFVVGDCFTEVGIIENMAQTAAARLGYVGRYVSGAGVKLGFIGEIKNLVIERLPRVGDRMITTVETVTELFSTLMIKCQVSIDDVTIAHGSMKISTHET